MAMPDWHPHTDQPQGQILYHLTSRQYVCGTPASMVCDASCTQ